MFTQQVANYDQDLGVTTTGPMQMNWLLRSEAYAWYFLPPVTSVLILWWYVPPCPAARNLSCFLTIAVLAVLRRVATTTSAGLWTLLNEGE